MINNLIPHTTLHNVKEWFFKNIRLERVAGIEPASQPWEGRILPLNHTR